MKLRSVAVLKTAVILCAVISVAIAVAAPWLIDWYVAFRNIQPGKGTAILICYYLCMIPTLTALYSMLKVLINIQKAHPFERKTQKYLGIISWCCLAVTVICAVGGYWVFTLAFLSCAMLFLFLTVRVVITCFVAGIALQEENDLTV